MITVAMKMNNNDTGERESDSNEKKKDESEEIRNIILIQ